MSEAPDLRSIDAKISGISTDVGEIKADLRVVRGEVTDARERIVRLEAQDIASRVNDLTKDFAKSKEDITILKTQLGPMLAAVSAFCSVVISWFISNLGGNGQ